MGALAATLIAGNDGQPPPPTTQLAAGELPETLKNLVTEYLAEEGYRPAAGAGEEPPPAPPPAPADVPPPAPAPAVPVPLPVPMPVPVAPVATRTGPGSWPIESAPEPVALPLRVPPPVIQAAAADVGAAIEAVPDVAEAAPEVVKAAVDTAPVTSRTEIGTPPEPAVVAAEDQVSFAAQESTPRIARQVEAAPEPEVSAHTITEVSSGDAIVVPAESEVG